MPIPGSETTSSAHPPETAPRETSYSGDLPEVEHGPDWPEAIPTIEGLNPNTLEVPGPDAWIVVHGTNYTPESVIVWNGQDVVTEFVNAGKLRTNISMTAVGVDPVLVCNGDIESNVVEFIFTAAEEARGKKRGR